MKCTWHSIDVGLYSSDIGHIIREHDGWTVYRLNPDVREARFTTLDAAKRWAESHIPALLVQHAAKRTA